MIEAVECDRDVAAFGWWFRQTTKPLTPDGAAVESRQLEVVFLMRTISLLTWTDQKAAAARSSLQGFPVCLGWGSWE